MLYRIEYVYYFPTLDKTISGVTAIDAAAYDFMVLKEAAKAILSQVILHYPEVDGCVYQIIEIKLKKTK